ncbi:hypothetical protein AB6A40_006015 [Gnathostoma spinigerum]|uniref:Uncharacterized protein n=1 Tax=Gnathostoma spinigerum TaxID=75299 RepID=A0ABD6EJ76_9BILA
MLVEYKKYGEMKTTNFPEQLEDDESCAIFMRNARSKILDNYNCEQESDETAVFHRNRLFSDKMDAEGCEAQRGECINQIHTILWNPSFIKDMCLYREKDTYSATFSNQM